MAAAPSAVLPLAVLLLAAAVGPGGGISAVALHQRDLRELQYVQLRPPAAGSHRVPLALAVSGAVAHRAAEGAGSRVRSAAAVPGVSADFYGAFSEGESTYTEAGDPAITRLEDGWDPALTSPLAGKTNPAKWFHESPSGGPAEAWQTFYPALKTGLNGGAYTNGEWVKTAGGSWQQQANGYAGYESTADDASEANINGGSLAAPWFDIASIQRDGFGRSLAPQPTSPKFYLDWQERSLNATLTCQTPGCIASGAMQLFSSSTEKARFCRMSVLIEHHSGGIPWITVNGANVSFECAPPASPCGEGAGSAARFLFPCVFDLNLAKLLTQSGRLEVAAKLSDGAESNCTYKGDALRAVPMVSCLVTDLAWPSTNLTNSEHPPTLQATIPPAATVGEAEVAPADDVAGAAAEDVAAVVNETTLASEQASGKPGHRGGSAEGKEAARLAANATAVARQSAQKGFAVAEPSGLAVGSVASAASNASLAKELGQALHVNATVMVLTTTAAPRAVVLNATADSDSRAGGSAAPMPREPSAFKSGSTVGQAAREALGVPTNGTEAAVALPSS